MIEPDIILADIITTDMNLSSSRVVVYDQNYKPPKDPGLYIIIALQSTKIISNTNNYIDSKNEEKKTVVVSETYNIEVTSKDRSAINRYWEILVALDSTYSQQKQEENQIRIFRTGNILDLSFIEGASSLQRYKIPVIIQSVREKDTAIDYYDKFQATKEAIG